jgi:hypothetical protein
MYGPTGKVLKFLMTVKSIDNKWIALNNIVFIEQYKRVILNIIILSFAKTLPC